jgi:hypothetical protein
MRRIKARLTQRSAGLTVVLACAAIAAFGGAAAFGSANKSKVTGIGKGDGVIGTITWNKASLASATKQNALNVGHPSPYVVTKKLKKKPKAGGTIWFLDCGDAECEGYIPGLTAAAKQFGWTIHDVNAGLSPTSVEAGVQAAIAGDATAIFDPGNPSSWFAQSAATLEADHIYVVADAPDSPLGGGIDGELADNANVTDQGAWMADSVYQLGGNQVRAVFAESAAIPLSEIMEAGFANRLKQLCSACTTATTSILPQDIGSPAMVSQEVSAVQGNPGTTWLVGFAGSFLIGVPQGLSAANLKINTFSQSGGPVNLGYIKAGSQTADLTPNENEVGWIAMDEFARLATGQNIPAGEEGQYAQEELHTRLNTPSNYSPTQGISYPGYQAHYEKLWGTK